MSTHEPLDGCAQCADPVSVALTTAALRRVNERIAIFQCPGCGGLILDDAVGFKGAGTCFRATERMIERYVRESSSRDCGYQFSDGEAE